MIAATANGKIPAPISRRPAASTRGIIGALVAALLIPFFSGCASFGNRGAHTLVQTKTAVLPARIVSNFFLVEAPQIDGKTYRFMIDTGSSATLVSPRLASALKTKPRRDQPQVTVPIRSADGKEVALPEVTLRQLSLGDAGFERVPALVNDFTELSEHLGVQIDGVIGFTLFREKMLTLDYPKARLSIEPYPLLAPPPPPKTSPHAVTLTFDNTQGTPQIPVQMGNESFFVLIDSGSDGGLSLNPSGLHPQFSAGPRPGKLAASLAGDHAQMVGRLGQNVTIGTQVVTRPVVDITDQLSSVGGELLSHFTVTFDQRRRRVIWDSATDGPIQMPPRQDTGLSFRHYPKYWRVLAVTPQSPAADSSIQAGDVCVRVNGEPIAQWNLERYAQMLRTAATVTYTIIVGPKEQDVELPVFSLVP
ncbi:MAG TPA: aspartyl protease family protein [Candidatus Didemnitutus sp.]|nr:aspartyl protease family protein [Candidatus Didemnitutus sp.]